MCTILPLWMFSAWCLFRLQPPRLDAVVSYPCRTAVRFSQRIRSGQDSYSKPTDTSGRKASFNFKALNVDKFVIRKPPYQKLQTGRILSGCTRLLCPRRSRKRGWVLLRTIFGRAFLQRQPLDAPSSGWTVWWSESWWFAEGICTPLSGCSGSPDGCLYLGFASLLGGSVERWKFLVTAKRWS